MLALCIGSAQAALLHDGALFSAAARPRSTPPALLAAKDMPTPERPPATVVQNQLAALQRNEVGTWFDFATSRVRRASAERKRFEQFVRAAPALKPLLGCESYKVLSSLQVGDRLWKCRVLVENKIGRVPFSVTYLWELQQQVQTTALYDLGQCILHKDGFRGVVAGWDESCRQSDDWVRAAGIDELPNGRKQPFYMILVHGREDMRFAYVAQDTIVPTPVREIDHPSFKQEFSGDVDKDAGTWEPKETLRDQYPQGLEGCWLVDQVVPDGTEDDEFGV